jgi:hypothetical protein
VIFLKLRLENGVRPMSIETKLAMVVFKFGNSFEKGSGLDGTRVPHHKLHAWTIATILTVNKTNISSQRRASRQSAGPPRSK